MVDGARRALPEPRAFYVDFRRYQEDILAAFEARRRTGGRTFQVVAPPGSGKTLVAIEIIHRLGSRAVVFVPTLAIQAQWVEMSDAYSDGVSAGTDPRSDVDILCLTYQVVSTRASDGSPHRNARAILGLVGDRGTVVFDECHHLTAEWARAVRRLDRDGTFLVGLTATPPTELEAGERELYRGLLGDVDCEVPLPPVIKEGYLAPFQDLVYVVAPTDAETASIGRRFAPLRAARKELVEATGFTPAHTWAADRIGDFRDARGRPVTYEELYRDRPGYCGALARFALAWVADLPPSVIMEPEYAEPADFDDTVTALGEYARFYLGAAAEADADGATGARSAYGKLEAGMSSIGYELAEDGPRRLPEGLPTLLLESYGKILALGPIVAREMAAQGDDFRCLILTDYESAEGRAGTGALDAMRYLTSDPDTDACDPILVTGATLLVDDDLLPDFMACAQAFFDERGLDIELEAEPREGFYEITSRSSRWGTQVYVPLVTRLLERGITKALVSTRSMLGEGWNAERLNTLIDLTAIAGHAYVNQMRGRTLRLDPERPLKVANNWDIVAVLPDADSGTPDLDRLERKYSRFFGMTADGVLERGIGHLHPDLSASTLAGLYAERDALNREMLARAGDRDVARAAWKIGQPYGNRVVHCLDVRPAFPPDRPAPAVRPAQVARLVRAGLSAAKKVRIVSRVIGACAGLTTVPFLFDPYDPGIMVVAAVFVGGFAAIMSDTAGATLIRFASGSRARLATRIEDDWTRFVASCWSVAVATLHRLGRCPDPARIDAMKLEKRRDGSIRVFLPDESVPAETAAAAARSVADMLAPVRAQPWILYAIAPMSPAEAETAWKATWSGKVRRRYASGGFKRADRDRDVPPREYEERVSLKGNADDAAGAGEPIERIGLTCVPVPRDFSGCKADAEAFLTAWTATMGPARLVGARSGEYEGVAARFRDRRVYPLAVAHREFWT